MTTLPAQPPRVLCADDNPTILDAIRVAGRRAQLQIDCVPDGQVALSRSLEADASYDLVLTDYEMPNMNGLALVRELRARGYRKAIIVMSGNFTNELSDEFRQSGADLLMEKPFLPSTLIRSINELLARDRGAE